MSRPPKYLTAVLQHLRANPGVHHVEVRHDDGCALFKRRPCDCSPTVAFGERIDRKYRFVWFTTESEP